MLLTLHSELLHQALDGRVSTRALEAIESANLAQDQLRYQIGHDEYHFDNNAIRAGRLYVEQQRGLIRPALERGEASSAWAAFGRLTHAVQDFYSHSNYVHLWLARRAGEQTLPPAEIEPLDPQLMESPELRSGKLYYPVEALYFIPALRRLSLSLLPKDAHAHMNLDSARQGWRFDYAFQAALKRTCWELEQLPALLSPKSFILFCDQPAAD